VNDAALTARRRSAAALELGRANEAVRYAKEAVAAAPDEAESFCVLSNALNVAGKYKAGRRAAKQAISLAPEMEWAHALLAVALFHLGRYEKALASVDEALRLVPMTGARHHLRGRILEKLDRKREAANEAARACELDPQDALAHDLVARLAFAEGRFRDAENEWRTALGIDPTSALRLNNFGAALDRQGRKDEAREAFRHAIRMDPSLEVSKHNLHQSVRSSLGTGTLVAGGGAAVALKLGALHGITRVVASSTDTDWVLGVLCVVMAIVLVGMWVVRPAWVSRRTRRLERELEARDPELMRLYRQIDGDIAAGRIRKNEGPRRHR
jgi:tetratricopeptide (TPR) repeat protein